MDINTVMKCLLEDNMTYAEIARKLGVSRQCVHQAVRSYNRKVYVKPTACIYVGLRNWLNSHRISIKDLISMCDGFDKKERTMHTYLNGERDMTKTTIDLILKATGLTYEQAFGNEVDRNENLL